MKVSWIIPVYNSGGFLNEAIESIFADTCPGIENDILLVDDCSSDPGTIALLKQWEGHADVRVIWQARNGGPSRARNAGIGLAQGDWITFLDSDDLLPPGTMQARQKAIQAHPDIRWIAGDLQQILVPGEVAKCHYFDGVAGQGTRIADRLYRIDNSARKLVAWGSLPYLGSMMLHKDLMKEAGQLNENLVFGEDMHFSLLLSQLTELYWIDAPCLLLRRYHESLTKDLLRGAREAPNASLACIRDPRLKGIKKEMRWRYSSDLRLSSQVFLSHGRRSAAIRSALRALIWAPNDRRSMSALWRTVTHRK